MVLRGLIYNLQNVHNETVPCLFADIFEHWRWLMYKCKADQNNLKVNFKYEVYRGTKDEYYIIFSSSQSSISNKGYKNAINCIVRGNS